MFIYPVLPDAGVAPLSPINVFVNFILRPMTFLRLIVNYILIFGAKDISQIFLTPNLGLVTLNFLWGL